MKNITASSLLSVVVTLLVPVVLILSCVRLLLMPLFLTFEYQMADFPKDNYGFSQTERLYYARFAVDYLVYNVDLDYLSQLRFPEGTSAPPTSCSQMTDCSYMFNERELYHMEDVKLVTQKVLQIWRAALILLALLGVLAWAKGWSIKYAVAIGKGGWLTTIFSGAILLGMLASFGIVFVAFHDIFFAPGTWMFLTSDTLIRLFPERFWRDVFLVALGLPAIIGLCLSLVLKQNRTPAEVSHIG